jgi:xanthine dehydrogenase YagR molybdenum-binding subunit
MSIASIGQAMSRVDGRLKVTGQATYAAEFDPPSLAHAVIVTSTVAKGRITLLETELAAREAGVLSVLTHRNAPKLEYRPHKAVLDPVIGERLHVLQDDQVRFNGQPVALVIAETLEQAEWAASLVHVEYAPEPAEFDFAAALERATQPEGWIGSRCGDRRRYAARRSSTCACRIPCDD